MTSPLSIRVRLTALFVGIFGATLTGFAILFYSTVTTNARTEFDAALYNYAVDVAEGININLFGDILIQKDALLAARRLVPFSVKNALLQIVTPEGRIVARSEGLKTSSLPISRADMDFLAKNGTELITLRAAQIIKDGGDGKYRLLDLWVKDRGPFNFILQVAMPTAPLEQQRARLMLFLFSSVPILLLVATLGGLYLSRRALQPVSVMIEKVRSMSSATLGERVPVPSVDDELKQLSLTLNDLLSRLQRAFESQERFIADASHELKTPLTILRGELDLMRNRQRSPEEISGFMASASHELDYLSRIVEDLLLLARVDAGSDTLSRTRVRLDEILMTVIERLDPAAKRKSIRIRFDLEGGDFETMADADLLQSMFKNIIENAIKFSPENSLIEVALRESAGDLTVSVKDQGPGIPADAVPKIFDRFYRGEDTGKTPGTGLGLAIVKRIAEVHGARIDLASRPGTGTLFSVEIKKI